MGGAIAKTPLDQNHQRVLISDQIDVFLTTLKLCHSNNIVRVVWISGVDSYSFSRERPLSTQHMHHHHTIREDVNLHRWMTINNCIVVNDKFCAVPNDSKLTKTSYSTEYCDIIKDA